MVLTISVIHTNNRNSNSNNWQKRKLLREDVNIHRTNLKYCGPKFVFSPTFIFCSPICSNNCGVVFCENIFQFSRNDLFRSTAQICKF